MISRKTCIALAEAYQAVFSHQKRTHTRYTTKYSTEVAYESLYDFAFAAGFEPWFCNMLRHASKHVDTYSSSRVVKEFVMRVHTGEFVSGITPNWTEDQRQRLGQEYLYNLAGELIRGIDEREIRTVADLTPIRTSVLRALELDGYLYRAPNLLMPDSDVVDSEEERNVLEDLYRRLELNDIDVALRHLGLSEENYSRGGWEDAIGNARKYLEKVLSEVANRHSIHTSGEFLSSDVYDWPSKVRGYLAKAKLLEEKEVSALKEVYGLLSETGGHPYMARSDQARLLRHLALTFSQFAMLRLEGFLGKD
ncbi:MAG: hypothetical protein IPM16_23780 [Chloroflexi bacterium]|nr:hypothetical protein [Chloroflexota bacterium]